MKTFRKLLILFLVALSFSNVALASEKSKITAKEALLKLKLGNQRFVNSRSIHPDQSKTTRLKLAKGQQPFAVIITCSDSRVPPEIIFDRGLGELFVVRVAGNVLNDDVIGSVEYAIEHLGSPLVVVLGHERCGAVGAAVKGVDQVCYIQKLVEKIKPAVNEAKDKPGDLVDNSIRNNVKLVVDELKESKPIVAEFVEEHKVQVIGAYYDLDTGKVEFTAQEESKH